MGGKARKRREKNYLAAHGGNNRLPPPPTPSSVDALPSKLRRIMAFASSSTPTLQGSATDSGNAATTNRKNTKDGTTQNNPHSKSNADFKNNESRDKRINKSTVSQGIGSSDANEEKKKKKRKRKQANDHRFEAELEKLGGVSKRKQRKKEFLKAKKKKLKGGKSEHVLDLPKHDEVKFGEVVEAPPKLAVIPAFKKAMDASRERLRLQAIEAYRSRKGWTSRPGIQLPSLSTSPDML